MYFKNLFKDNSQDNNIPIEQANNEKVQLNNSMIGQNE